MADEEQLPPVRHRMDDRARPRLCRFHSSCSNGARSSSFIIGFIVIMISQLGRRA